MRHFGWWLILSSVALFAFPAACGGTNAEAPRAEPRAKGDTLMCKGFDELMPNFVRALEQGRTENLRKVIKDHLLVPERVGDPPPINDVMRAIFTTLTAFAKKQPEQGAPAGELCAVTPPPLDQSNELCEMRRALELLVHQGKGIEAIKLIDPQIAGVLNYIIGQGKDKTPHYEVARVLASQCAQDADCQLVEGLNLVVALSVFLENADGKKLLADLDTLTASGGDAGLPLNLDALTENDVVGLSKVLLGAVQSGTPADLEALLNNPLLAPYQMTLRPIIDDLKKILDPAYIPNLIGPTRKVLNCINRKDTNSDVVRMLYRLALGPNKLPEFGFSRLTRLLQDVRAVDQRGALVHLLGTIAVAVRNDEQAIDSAANVCRTLLSTAPVAGQARSNAELALPVVADLFAAGVASEAVCAIDTLVFGCAGGAQPACLP